MVQLALAVETEFGGGDGDDPWGELAAWHRGSDAERLRIESLKADPAYDAWDDLDAWAADRSALIWTFQNTPAASVAEMRIKARLAQEPDGPARTDTRFEKVIGLEIADSLLKDILAQANDPDLHERRRAGAPMLRLVQ